MSVLVDKKQVILELIHKKNFPEALKYVQNLESSNDLNKEDNIALQLMKSQIYTNLGSPDIGLQLVEQVLKQHRDLLQKRSQLDAIVAKSEALRHLGKFEEHVPQIGIFGQSREAQLKRHLNLLEQGEKLLEDLVYQSILVQQDIEARIRLNKGITLRMLDHLDHSLQELNQSLALFKNGLNKEGIAESLASIGATYAAMGEFNAEEDHVMQSLGIYETISDEEAIAYTYMARLNAILQFKGQFERTLEYLQKANTISLKLGNQKAIGLSLHYLGDFYTRQGDLDRGKHYLDESMPFFEAINYKKLIAHTLQHYGWINLQRGNIETAFDYFNQSLATYEEVENNDWRIWPIWNLGIIAHYRGNFEEALKLYNKSLNLAINYKSISPIVSNFGRALALWKLGTLAFDMHAENQLSTYLVQLQSLYDQYKYPYIIQMHRLLQATVLKEKDRLKDKVKAQELFQLISEDVIIIREITVLALLQQCELFIFELKTTGNEYVLFEVKTLTTRLLEIGKKQQSYSVQIEASILQAQYAILEGDLQQALSLFDQAKSIAETQNLFILLNKVTFEQQRLQTEFEKWQDLIQRHASFQERIEHLKIENYLKEAQKTLNFLR